MCRRCTGYKLNQNNVYNSLADANIRMFKRTTLEELEEVKAIWIEQRSVNKTGKVHIT
jgi:hypothetical protein